MTRSSRFQVFFILTIFLLVPSMAYATCADIATALGGPIFPALQAALAAARTPGAVGTGNGGLNFHMWATIVDRDGVVCAVARTGGPGDQWPGSRVISAQKANTANAFSLPGFALSTANLYSPVQPGGSLFGLQESNPVDPNVAYAGTAADWGTASDPLVTKRVGGVNVFGGGLGLYKGGVLLGGLGVSGDTSCADHIIAWKVRDALDLDNVPNGVAPGGTDNIIHDITAPGKSQALEPKSAGGFGHPTCLGKSTSVAAALPTTNPVE